MAGRELLAAVTQKDLMTFDARTRALLAQMTLEEKRQSNGAARVQFPAHAGGRREIFDRFGNERWRFGQLDFA